MIAAAHGPSTLWYATRGAGAVALVLLTISVALGVAETRMWRPAGAPRFAVAAVHRSASLLAVVFVALHVLTVVLDPFPHIGLLTGVVPFTAGYRRLWLGLGTIGFDLLLAVVITSLVRARLGYRAWRGVHWLAYASWPVALVHGLGSGSDARTTWMVLLSCTCVAVVLAAVGARLAVGVAPVGRRGLAAAAVAAATLATAIWALQGPMAAGWARRAGTPKSVLTAFSPPRTVRVAARRQSPSGPLLKPFAASLSGQIHEGLSADGTGVVDLSMDLAGGPPGRLRIRLGGHPLPGGGLQLQRSAVSLGPPGDPARYQGRIESLRGTRLHARVGGADGAIRLLVDLSLGAETVSGEVHGVPLARVSR